MHNICIYICIYIYIYMHVSYMATPKKLNKLKN